MKRIACVVAALLMVGRVGLSQAPTAEIANKQLRVKVYLPDAKAGFYRATRFDWSGAIADLSFEGHHIYQPWFAEVDPAVRDVDTATDKVKVGLNSAMEGPVEEFQTAIGFDTAKPGETFLKVGVGLLRKGDDPAYQFAKHFDLVDGGTWTTKKTADSITFIQTLGGPDKDYGYVYTKTLRVVPNEAKLLIEHSLKNTGKLPIATKVYDHNFLTIDGVVTGSAYSVTVPYEIKPTRAPDAKFATIAGGKATYIADLKGTDRVAFGLQGFGPTAKDYDFRIENSAAKVVVRMQGDKPLVDASLWSIRSVVAVEPFINVSADPGKEFDYTYTYTYSTLGK